MAKKYSEIERQFVVNTNHPSWIELKPTLKKIYITQSTIHRGSGNKLRVRLFDDPDTNKKSAFFTFKVRKNTKKDAPNIRDEYEWEVPYRVALYIMIWHGEVTKTRYIYVHSDGKKWELDEFTGANTGITLADIELDTIDEKFKVPEFLWKETTKEKRITNNSFTLHPFANWNTKEKEWYESLKKRK